jgi:hypothetical protein
VQGLSSFRLLPDDKELGLMGELCPGKIWEGQAKNNLPLEWKRRLSADRQMGASNKARLAYRQT